MSKTRQPPNTANQNNPPFANLDFTEPPQIQVIEASCDLADKRSDDNSEWTNILKEPTFIQKGSEIRCVSSFLDMKGMDQEIIQFESSGNDQDNSHTMLTHIYTVNDGFNGKTTSSDYICRPQNYMAVPDSGVENNDNAKSWEVTNPGTMVPSITNDVCNMVNAAGVAIATMRIIAPTNIGRAVKSLSFTLDSGGLPQIGSGYRTGDALTFSGSGDRQARGFVVVDDLGVPKRFEITDFGYYDPTVVPTVLLSDESGGSGCVLTVTPTAILGTGDGRTGAASSAELLSANGVTFVGEKLTAIIDFNPSDFEITVRAVDTNGLIILRTMFDQGYNYQRVPLYRYCQTFALDEQLTFGNNFLNRQYTTGAGNNVFFPSQPLEIKEDAALSAYGALKRREDEFVPGIFHKAGIDNRQDFLIYGAFTRLSIQESEIQWLFGWEEGYSCIYMIDQIVDQIVDGVSYPLQGNILNRYPVGTCLSLSFDLSTNYNGGATSGASVSVQYTEYNRLWGGLYQVGKNEYITGGKAITISGVVYDTYRRITFGSPHDFKPSVLATNKGLVSALQGTFKTGVPIDFTDTPLSLRVFPAINHNREDGETPTGSGLTCSFTFDAQGVVSNASQPSIVSAGEGYKKGDVVKFENSVGTANNYFMMITEVDNKGGQTWSAPMSSTLQSSNLQSSNVNFNYAVFISPLPFYGCGVGQILNRGPDFQVNYNSVCMVKYTERLAGQSTFNGYTRHPPTFIDLGIEETGTFAPTNSYGANGFNGLYKNNGLKPSDNNYAVNNANFSSHSLIEYTEGAIGVRTITEATSFEIGGNSTTGFIIQAFLNVNDNINTGDMFPISPTQNHIDIKKTVLDNLVGGAESNFYKFPSNYLVLNVTNADGSNETEEHMLLLFLGPITIDGVQCYRLQMRMRNVHQARRNRYYTSDPEFDGIYGNFTLSDDISNGGGFPFAMLSQPRDVVSTNIVRLQWIVDESKYLHRISTTWDYTKKAEGTLAFTAATNFYNTKDPNLSALKGIPVFDQILNVGEGVDPLQIQSYNEGGNYFLTHNHGYLANTGLTNTNNLDYSEDFGFSQGFNEFLLTRRMPYELSTNNTAWFPVQSEYVDNLQSNATNVFGYEPLLKQKTITINRDFAVPSDIGGFWTRDTHKLTGIADPLTGKEIASVDNCGILQNEFIFPVYGSNNAIDANGNYVIDKLTYPDSGGLEPGHVIGRFGIDSDSVWLSNSVKIALPSDKNSNFTYQNLFFRTFFTQIRNYDALAKDTTNPGLPDRTPLKTLSTEAGKIGNFSFAKGYVQEGPPTKADGSDPQPPGAGPTSTVTKKLLDGATTIVGMLNGPGAAGTPFNFPKKIYELGDPNPSAEDTPFYFRSNSTEYPVRYLDNVADNSLARAKISSYVGSTNLTLAYQSDLSAFAFEFFHMPFTSPFVDGTGGETAARIFYGNRKKGVYNHDALGGVAVINYARPDYPHGVVTYRESQSNIKNTYYPNGIKPDKGVATIGRAFLNKLGFTDKDLGIKTINGLLELDTSLTSPIGISNTGYSQDLFMTNNGVNTQFTFFSTNTVVRGTTEAEIDSSNAVLSSIPAPENSPGLNNHITRQIPTFGQDNTIVNRFGDRIFYPYSIDSNTDSFNSTGSGAYNEPVDASRVRYDNCTDAYGSIGGLAMTEAGRGMGTPNTQGSTTITNQNTIPVSLNPDCNIYLSYTIQAQSSYKLASSLPRKLNHGHLIVISNLVEKPNYILNSAGAVNGISIVNKSFITGDFILSIGQLSFFAQEDRFLSRISTKIVNSSYNAPTTLGRKSTVIYQIINNNPRPMRIPMPITTAQDRAYQLMSYMKQHQQAQATGVESRLANLHRDLYQLGISTLQDPNNANSNIINSLENYISGYDLPSMTPAQRRDFYSTPEGGAFLTAATNYSNLRGDMEAMDNADDPVVAQQLQDNIALQLRALDRGTELPPVPIGMDSLNPQFDPEIAYQQMLDDDQTPIQEQIPDPLDNQQVYDQIIKETPAAFDYEFDQVGPGRRFDPDRRLLRNEPRQIIRSVDAARAQQARQGSDDSGVGSQPQSQPDPDDEK